MNWRGWNVCGWRKCPTLCLKRLKRFWKSILLPSIPLTVIWPNANIPRNLRFPTYWDVMEWVWYVKVEVVI